MKPPMPMRLLGQVSKGCVLRELGSGGLDALVLGREGGVVFGAEDALLDGALDAVGADDEVGHVVFRVVSELDDALPLVVRLHGADALVDDLLRWNPGLEAFVETVSAAGDALLRGVSLVGRW
jgi:hypothetical protein